jgi:capsular polysaccharide biosynthesis protein
MSFTAASRPRGSSRPGALIRRLWILPLSMAVVAALASAVSGLQSATYTAQSTVVVTSAPGNGATATSANQASELASTYSSSLPHDPVLQSYVTHHAGVQATSAISALPSRGSLVRLKFTASSPSAAVKGAQALARGLSGEHPASAVLTPGALKLVQKPTGAAPAGLTALGTQRYQATAVFVVPPSAAPSEGINPDDADHLAQTYAGIIPTDDRLLGDVGKAVGESSATVGENLSVVNQQNTSLLEISFKSSQPNQAAEGARTAARLLTGPAPAAAGIVPSSLQIVSLPKNPGPAAKSKGKAVVIGAALGLVLGIVLLIAWERSDPRIADARELSSQIGCPATPVDRLSPNASYALLERWASLTEHVPARVAILPASPSVEIATVDAVNDLLSAGGRLVRYVDARAGIVPQELANGAAESRTGVVLVHAGPPGGQSAGEAIALGCDLTVVVVPAGSRAADVRQLGEELTSFGIVPVWALLTSGSRRAARRQAQVADAVPR